MTGQNKSLSCQPLLTKIYEDMMYIARTHDYFNYDEEKYPVYAPDFWTYSEDANDDDFADTVYELNDEGERILDWWLRCRRMNEWERCHSFNCDRRSPEEIWEVLTNPLYSSYRRTAFIKFED